MADFDTDWKITGSPDPATPDPQPHQVQAQPQPQQSYQAPVQQASQTVPGFVPAPVQQQPVAQPQFIGYNVNGPVYRNANGFVARAHCRSYGRKGSEPFGNREDDQSFFS